MNLIVFPNWDSLDSVRRAHSNLELAAIVFFALLVVMEALAHNSKADKRKHRFDSIGIWFFALAVICELSAYRYGQRNDELSGGVISSLDTKATNASGKAAKALWDSETAMQKAHEADAKATLSDKKVKSVATQADRIGGTLGETISLVNARRVENADKLSAELKKRFKGRKVQLVSYVGDVEAWGLCTQLLGVAKDAGMVPEDICGKAWFTAPLISPLSITAPNWDEALGISKPLLTIGRVGSTSVIGPNLIIFAGVKSPFILGETDQTKDAGKRAAAVKKLRKLDAKP